ncbi:hypothetical protein ACJX0J_006092, partial [Zea mays]
EDLQADYSKKTRKACLRKNIFFFQYPSKQGNKNEKKVKIATPVITCQLAIMVLKFTPKDESNLVERKSKLKEGKNEMIER